VKAKPVIDTPPFDKIDPAAFKVAPEIAKAATEAHTSEFFSLLNQCRLSDDDTAGLGVGHEILTTLPVQRPSRKQYVCCHSDPLMQDSLATYIDEDDGETYLVTDTMRDEVFGEDVKPTHLILTMIHRSRSLFIWSSTIPTADSGRGKKWYESALSAKNVAKTRWIKVVSDKSISGYRCFPSQGDLAAPVWPTDKTFQEYLEIAFRDRIITSMDHPVVRKFLGQM
jgi:hypothetical protein